MPAKIRNLPERLLIFVDMIEKSILDGAVEKIFGHISFTDEPAGLYDPLRYMISIGGKRLRPSLCLLAYSLFKDRLSDEIAEPAAALEVFHTFTLIHDDIMDRSPLRRGEPTVWKKWCEDTAILSGDVMLIDAYRRIAKVPEESRDEAMDLFTTTAAQVCEGQQFDMEFEDREDVAMEEYDKMIGLKTAVLLACSAKMGALVAGAPKEKCDALYCYGYELGMAFQIADDYLDAYGDEKVFGKPIGGDIINEKKSWLTIRALQKTADRAVFMKAFTSPAGNEAERNAKIRAVRDIYDSLGVADDARDEIVRFSSRAIDAVVGVGLDGEQVCALRSFADNLVGRVK